MQTSSKFQVGSIVLVHDRDMDTPYKGIVVQVYDDMMVEIQLCTAVPGLADITMVPTNWCTRVC